MMYTQKTKHRLRRSFVRNSNWNCLCKFKIKQRKYYHVSPSRSWENITSINRRKPASVVKNFSAGIANLQAPGNLISWVNHMVSSLDLLYPETSEPLNLKLFSYIVQVIHEAAFLGTGNTIVIEVDLDIVTKFLYNKEEWLAWLEWDLEQLCSKLCTEERMVRVEQEMMELRRRIDLLDERIERERRERIERERRETVLAGMLAQIESESMEIDREPDMVALAERESMELYVEATCPASKASVAALERMVFRSRNSVEKCTICIEKFLNEVVVRKLPCSHIFHGDCIGQWLEQKNTCPVCRFEFPVE